MACIPPNPRRVGYIVPIHGPLDGPLYMGSIYSNTSPLIAASNMVALAVWPTWIAVAITETIRKVPNINRLGTSSLLSK